MLKGKFIQFKTKQYVPVIQSAKFQTKRSNFRRTAQKSVSRFKVNEYE